MISMANDERCFYFRALCLQDKAVKAKVDSKNQLETYIYSVKSTVEDKAKVGGRVLRQCGV